MIPENRRQYKILRSCRGEDTFLYVSTMNIRFDGENDVRVAVANYLRSKCNDRYDIQEEVAHPSGARVDIFAFDNEKQLVSLIECRDILTSKNVTEARAELRDYAEIYSRESSQCAMELYVAGLGTSSSGASEIVNHTRESGVKVWVLDEDPNFERWAETEYPPATSETISQQYNQYNESSYNDNNRSNGGSGCGLWIPLIAFLAFAVFLIMHNDMENTIHVVTENDRGFYSIALKHGTTVEELERLNPGVVSDNIQKGQKLKVPRK